VRTLNDLPAVSASLLRAKQAQAFEEVSTNAHSIVVQCLNIGFSSLCMYRSVLLACFEKTSSVLAQQMPSACAAMHSSDSSSSVLSARIQDIFQSTSLLHAVLDALGGWAEATSSSSSASWLSARDLCQPVATADNDDPAAAASVLQHMEFMLSSIRTLLFYFNTTHAAATDVVDCESLVMALQNCIHKILELFSYFLLFPSAEMAAALCEHYSLQSPCTLDQQQICVGVLCIFRSVSVTVEWLIDSGNHKYDLDAKLQALSRSLPPTPFPHVSFGCLKECLFATSPTDSGYTHFINLLQRAFASSGLTLHSSADTNEGSDEEEEDGGGDDDGFISICMSMSEVVALLLEKHLDTLVLLEGTPLCAQAGEAVLTDGSSSSSSSGSYNINTLTNLVYFSLLLPHEYAKVTIMEALGALLVDCSTLNSRKHSEQKQHVMGLFLQRFFPANSGGDAADVVIVFNVISVLSKSLYSNDEEQLGETGELVVASTEVFRCLWRLVLSPSSPLVAGTPVLLSALCEQQVYPLCGLLRAVYEQHAHLLHASASWQEGEGEVFVRQLQGNAKRAFQLQRCLISLLQYLTIFVEDTVEHFGLDEDEDEEGTCTGRAINLLVYLLYYIMGDYEFLASQ
jgi:hypothetical protein